MLNIDYNIVVSIMANCPGHHSQDINRAVNAALWGGMSNAGQTCISVERIFVQDKIKDSFIEKNISPFLHLLKVLYIAFHGDYFI